MHILSAAKAKRTSRKREVKKYNAVSAATVIIAVKSVEYFENVIGASAIIAPTASGVKDE